MQWGEGYFKRNDYYDYLSLIKTGSLSLSLPLADLETAESNYERAKADLEATLSELGDL